MNFIEVAREVADVLMTLTLRGYSLFCMKLLASEIRFLTEYRV